MTNGPKIKSCLFRRYARRARSSANTLSRDRADAEQDCRWTAGTWLAPLNDLRRVTGCKW
jgi:hypothetical protein